MDAELSELLAVAAHVRQNAHAPYSGFFVGAAVRSASGAVFAGCNLENGSFGATICAEQSAVAAMIAAGERELVAVAVYTESETPVMPCGICRQVLLEFARAATIVAGTPTARRVISLAELMPEPFIFKR